MLSTQPIIIMREVPQQLGSQRIGIPGNSDLQNMVGRSVTSERNRITGLFDATLTPAAREQLDTLLEADENMYRIGALKREAKTFIFILPCP